MQDAATVFPYGDSALLVSFGDTYSVTGWEQAHRLATLIRKQLPNMVLEVIPTYCSVFVGFDALRASPAEMRDHLGYLVHEVVDAPVRGIQSLPARLFRIPVLYGGEYGPDLEDVATVLGMSPRDVVALHFSKTYRILCLGSPVSEPLMDAPPFGRSIPRRPVPRTDVPAGAVAVAGQQTVVYTLKSPGGWQLIGRSPLSFVNFHDMPPVPYRPGDGVQFFPITEEDYGQYAGKSVGMMMAEGS